MPSEHNQKRLRHRQTRDIVANIVKICDEESKKRCLSFPLSRATQRAASYTNRSLTFIKTIRQESKLRDRSETFTPLRTPGKHRPRTNDRVVHVNDRNMAVIRGIIHEFYIREKKFPTCNALLPLIRKTMHFPWSSASVRRTLNKLGFTFRLNRSKRRILVEKPRVVANRDKYFTAIKQFRCERKKIFYIDDRFWIDSCVASEKSNPDDVNPRNKLDIFLCRPGYRVGYIENVGLMFEAGSSSDDFGDVTDVSETEKWLKENFLPNIPLDAVIVFGSSQYHRRNVTVKCKSEAKPLALSWLEHHGNHCSPFGWKPSEYRLYLQNFMQTNKEENTFRLDHFLRSEGFTVLRLPQFLSDLNPLELAWTKVKNYVDKKSVSEDLGPLKLMQEAISTVTKEDWEGYCRQVEALEQHYWDVDVKVEDTIDEIMTKKPNMNIDSDYSSSEDECSFANIEETIKT